MICSFDLGGQLDCDGAPDTFVANNLLPVPFERYLRQSSLDMVQTELSALNVAEQVQSDQVQFDQVQQKQATAKRTRSERTRRREKFQGMMFIRKFVPREECSYLDLLPPEIRKEIFSLLLISPIVGDPRVFKLLGQKHGLNPAILRTCRRFNVEAMPVLYAANVFSISLIPYSFSGVNTFFSPLTRYIRRQQEFDNDSEDRVTKLQYGVEHKFLEQIAGFSRVRRWRILVSPCYDASEDVDLPHKPRNLEVLLFCRAACQNRMKSIEILPICFYHKEPVADFHQGMSLDEVLNPLRVFRQVEALTLATSHKSYYLPPGRQELPSNLKLLVEGDTPTERVFLMYEQLLAYAQSFERCEKFKTDMGRSESSNRQKMLNLFMCFPRHPVESALDSAKHTGNRNNRQGFNFLRGVVTKNLEQQYKKISDARKAIDGDIWHGEPVFDMRYIPGNRRVLGAKHREVPKGPRPPELIRLERYAASFQRHPLRSAMEEVPRTAIDNFYRIYAMMDREEAVKQLRWALGEGEFEQAEKYYHRALNDMDVQLKEIRQARDIIFAQDESGKYPISSVRLLG